MKYRNLYNNYNSNYMVDIVQLFMQPQPIVKSH